MHGHRLETRFAPGRKWRDLRKGETQLGEACFRHENSVRGCPAQRITRLVVHATPSHTRRTWVLCPAGVRRWSAPDAAGEQGCTDAGERAVRRMYRVLAVLTIVSVVGLAACGGDDDDDSSSSDTTSASGEASAATRSRSGSPTRSPRTTSSPCSRVRSRRVPSASAAASSHSTTTSTSTSRSRTSTSS